MNNGATLIREGNPADYLALAHLHPRPRPATIDRVFVARSGSHLAGALVVSRPALNAVWRDVAWPGRFTGPRAQAARRLNREVRTISRVVVAPPFRGRGLAQALVRACLRAARANRTEAVTHQRRAFFVRAGMSEIVLPPSPQDARLLDALHAAGVPRAALPRAPLTPFLRRELRRWANDSRATRALLRHPPRALAHAAARELRTRRYAYIHTQGHTRSNP